LRNVLLLPYNYNIHYCENSLIASSSKVGFMCHSLVFLYLSMHVNY